MTAGEWTLCAGIFCLLLAISMFLFKRKRYAQWVKTSGIVEKLIADHNGYAPQITFKTTAGKNVIFMNAISSSPPVAQIGESVKVIYDPQHPETAVIDYWWHRHFVECGLVVMSIIAFGYADILLQ